MPVTQDYNPDYAQLVSQMTGDLHQGNTQKQQQNAQQQGQMLQKLASQPSAQQQGQMLQKLASQPSATKPGPTAGGGDTGGANMNEEYPSGSDPLYSGAVDASLGQGAGAAGDAASGIGADALTGAAGGAAADAAGGGAIEDVLGALL